MRKPCAKSSGNGLLYAEKAVPYKDYFMHPFSESSTIKGLLYAGWKSRCKAFVARKACIIALEQSARKLSSDKQQSTFIHELEIPWGFHTQAVLHSSAGLCHTRKCWSKGFCNKERYVSCTVQRMFTADAFRKIWKGENLLILMLLPGFHKHLVLRNPHVLFQKHGGACTMY